MQRPKLTEAITLGRHSPAPLYAPMRAPDVPAAGMGHTSGRSNEKRRALYRARRHGHFATNGRCYGVSSEDASNAAVNPLRDMVTDTF
jgi:hypothetical protein